MECKLTGQATMKQDNWYKTLRTIHNIQINEKAQKENCSRDGHRCVGLKWQDKA